MSGCDMECSRSKTCRRRSGGTCGLGCLVDILHSKVVDEPGTGTSWSRREVKVRAGYVSSSCWALPAVLGRRRCSFF